MRSWIQSISFGIILSILGSIRLLAAANPQFKVELREDPSMVSRFSGVNGSGGGQATAVDPKATTRVQDLDEINFTPYAIVQVLDKITAVSVSDALPIGEEKQFFERLSVKVYKCWKAPPEEKPENKALLEIYEQKDQRKKLIFRGWMLTSNSGVSSLEHPLYDVILVECSNEGSVFE